VFFYLDYEFIHSWDERFYKDKKSISLTQLLLNWAKSEDCKSVLPLKECQRLSTTGANVYSGKKKPLFLKMKFKMNPTLFSTCFCMFISLLCVHCTMEQCKLEMRFWVKL
jgi:hypothetical protein